MITTMKKSWIEMLSAGKNEDQAILQNRNALKKIIQIERIEGPYYFVELIAKEDYDAEIAEKAGKACLLQRIESLKKENAELLKQIQSLITPEMKVAKVIRDYLNDDFKSEGER